MAVSGCTNAEPVAAPTSTLPAPASSTASPTVPPYETDLDLNDEEKKAAEEALMALDAYIDFSNRFYKSGGELLNEAKEYTTGKILDELKNSSSSLAEDKEIMTGQISIENIRIDRIHLTHNKSSKIYIQACTPKNSYHFIKKNGGKTPHQDSSESLFEYKVVEQSSDWKIAKQSLIGESC